MCRTGGRRCPSSNPTGKARAEFNARRRSLYAAKKAAIKQEQETVKAKEIETVIIVDEKQQKQDAAMNKALKSMFENTPTATESDVIKDKGYEKTINHLKDILSGKVVATEEDNKKFAELEENSRLKRTTSDSFVSDKEYEESIAYLKSVLEDKTMSYEDKKNTVKKAIDDKKEGKKTPAPKKSKTKKTLPVDNEKKSFDSLTAAQKKVALAKHKKSFSKRKVYIKPKREDSEYTALYGQHRDILDALSKSNLDHCSAVRDYIGNKYYSKLNKELRENGGSIEHLKNVTKEEYENKNNIKHNKDYPDYPKELMRISNNLDSYLADFNNGEEKIVYRGVYQDKSGEAPFDNLKEGDAVDFSGFSSTSNNIGIAYSFSNGIVFEMKTKKGAYIAGAEEEVILPKKTKWRVVGKKDAVYKLSKNPLERYKIQIIQLVEEELLD